MEKYEAVSPPILHMDIRRESKAIIAFLQYAARQETSGTGELPKASFPDVKFSLPSQ